MPFAPTAGPNLGFQWGGFSHLAPGTLSAGRVQKSRAGSACPGHGNGHSPPQPAGTGTALPPRTEASTATAAHRASGMSPS